jgi:hypothetical protein
MRAPGWMPYTGAPPSGCLEVRDAPVERERPDQERRTVRLEVLAGISGDPDRVAHVVQAVEEADDVVGPRIRLGAGDLERGAVLDPVANAIAASALSEYRSDSGSYSTSPAAA